MPAEATCCRYAHSSSEDLVEHLVQRNEDISASAVMNGSGVHLGATGNVHSAVGDIVIRTQRRWPLAECQRDLHERGNQPVVLHHVKDEADHLARPLRPVNQLVQLQPFCQPAVVTDRGVAEVAVAEVEAPLRLLWECFDDLAECFREPVDERPVAARQVRQDGGARCLDQEEHISTGDFPCFVGFTAGCLDEGAEVFLGTESEREERQVERVDADLKRWRDDASFFADLL